MHLKEFYQGISLRPEAAALLEGFGALESVQSSYACHRQLFYEDQDRYFQELTAYPDHRLWFFYEYCRMACEVWETYQKEKIHEKIYWDTFSDLSIWCENCFLEYGEYGIAQFDWLFRHIKMKLFRLGRLQFEIPGEKELQTIPKIIEQKIKEERRTLLFVHIPQGEPLLPDACADSFRQADRFFGKEKNKPIFLCHSWLLGENLREILPENSNIREFQKQFQILSQDYETREAEERIFGMVQEEPEKYQENTRLQISAKEFLLSGRQLGNGFGIIL